MVDRGAARVPTQPTAVNQALWGHVVPPARDFLTRVPIQPPSVLQAASYTYVPQPARLWTTVRGVVFGPW